MDKHNIVYLTMQHYSGTKYRSEWQKQSGPHFNEKDVKKKYFLKYDTQGWRDGGKPSVTTVQETSPLDP